METMHVLIIMIVLIGFIDLKNTIKQNSKAVVYIYYNSLERLNGYKDIPKYSAKFRKECHFHFTPATGMCFDAASLEGFEITQVTMSEYGSMVVRCDNKLYNFYMTFEELKKYFKKSGWEIMS